VTLVSRASGTKTAIPLAGAAAAAADGLAAEQAALFAQALDLRDAATREVDSIDDATAAGRDGFAVLPAATVLAGDGEDRLGQQGVSVRCLRRADEAYTEDLDDPELQAVVARAY
jgi:prolyl-tRNA synthetase